MGYDNDWEKEFNQRTGRLEEKPTSSCMVDSVVLFDHQARIIAAILSETPMTLCLGRRYGVATAKRIANQIKREINIIQNAENQALTR